MNKIKIVLFMMVIVFLSGCTATYEVTINNNKISEKLKVIETNQLLFDVKNDAGWTLRDTFESIVNSDDEFSVPDYKVKSLSNDYQLGLEYKSQNKVSILNSSILNQCYENSTVKIQDGIVNINTGNNFKCYEYYDNLETVKIVLKTNHKVKYTNAHQKDDNSYIWNFDKNSDKQIQISYYEDFVKKDDDYITIIVIIVSIVIIAVLFSFVIKKNKNNNKI